MIYCTYKSCTIEGFAMTFLFMHMVYFSHIHPLLFPLVPLTPLLISHSPSSTFMISNDQMDFMKAALTSKGKGLFAGAQVPY